MAFYRYWRCSPIIANCRCDNIKYLIWCISSTSEVTIWPPAIYHRNRCPPNFDRTKAIQLTCQFIDLCTYFCRFLFADQKCGPVNWNIVADIPPPYEPIWPAVTMVAFRTNILALVCLILSSLWIVTSLMLIGECGDKQIMRRHKSASDRASTHSRLCRTLQSNEITMELIQILMHGVDSI